MMCPICGSDSAVLLVDEPNKEHRVNRARWCANGHRFETVEVHPTQLADRREMSCAVRRIERRIAQHKRDGHIAHDPRGVKEVAAAFKITEARVRQIRASFRSLPAERDPAKIDPLTQKGN